MSKKRNGVRYSLKKANETKRESAGLLWNRDKMKNRRGYVIDPFIGFGIGINNAARIRPSRGGRSKWIGNI